MTEHYFAPYVNERSVSNPALKQAFDEYASFITTAEFSDVSIEQNKKGWTVDAVREHFNSSVEPEHKAFDKKEEALTYIYKSEEEIADSNNHYTATTHFHFLDRRLLYAEVRMQIDSAENVNYITEEALKPYLAGETPYEEYLDLSPQTFGFSQMFIDGRMIHQLYIPFVDAKEEEHAAFVIFDYNRVTMSYYSKLQAEFEKEENTMLRNFLRYEQQTRRWKADLELHNFAVDIDHDLDGLIQSSILENAAAQIAFQYFKRIHDAFKLDEVDTQKGEGPTIQEVMDTFEGEKEPTRVKVAEDEEYLIYNFKSDQINPNTGQERKAELKLYFLNDRLVYMDVFGLDSHFYANEQIPFEHALKLFQKGATLKTIETAKPILMGLGQFQLNGEVYSILLSPQFNKKNIMIMVNYIIKNGRILQAFASPYEQVKATVRNAMTQTYIKLAQEDKNKK